MVHVDGFIKAGLYGNHISQSSVGVNFGPDSLSQSTGHAALVAELGFTANVQLTDRLFAYGGYQLMWLEGVAIAPEQTPWAGAINAGGSPFYHGAMVGLGMNW